MTKKTVESMILSIDPRMTGGLISMQRAMGRAHVSLGLRPTLAFKRALRDRWDMRVREGSLAGMNTLSVGYLPSVEYLNYLAPALLLRRRCARFQILQLVSGAHSESLVPIIAQRPFVSWVATPYSDEIDSQILAEKPTLSVRLNHRLKRANNSIERWTYRFPAKVFALSAYTARSLARSTGLPASRFEVLHFPIDLQLFTPKGAPWAGTSRPYLLSVSRVDDERKNVPALVPSFARIASNHPGVDLVLVGPVDLKGSVVRLAGELGLGGRVRFVGELNRELLASAFRSACAYVMTSRQEGLGIVVLEAQASGLPAIIMRCGGSDELVQDGANGWLVDQGDEEGFSRALDVALANPDLRHRAGDAARRGVEIQASYGQFTERLGRAYKEVFGIDGTS